jgi:hypothetical protein
VIVVGSLILIGESRVASIAYAWGCAMEITKLVSCEEVSLFAEVGDDICPVR